MQNFEIPWPSGVGDQRLVRIIDQAIAAAGLIVTLRGSLKSFPGCTHWHVKNGQERGTLEITIWPPEHRAWFSVQSGRQAGWIGEKMKLLREIVGNKTT
jgi:hypothetical protein